VQLIDGTGFSHKMRKSLGSKRKELGADDIQTIVQLYGDANESDPEPDTDLRDTENVPLSEDIHEYFAREVLPHVPDAWIDESKTKIGYEIPFTRHFYKYVPRGRSRRSTPTSTSSSERSRSCCARWGRDRATCRNAREMIPVPTNY
jgi:type I restriction-modification system DNA methylase subunit